jgi:hypothetical protein
MMAWRQKPSGEIQNSKFKIQGKTKRQESKTDLVAPLALCAGFEL